MADADVLKEFFVSLGWKVDEAGQRRAHDSLKRTHEQVQRFKKSTQEGAGAWAKFFQQFQRADHPQRQHIETTLRLNKAYELLGFNLKQLATFATGGSLAASFATLTNQFDKLYYSAQQAGTSVGDLMKLQFGGQQVGISPAEMTSALINLRRALGGLPGPGIAQMLQGLGLNVMDPATGKIKDTSQAVEELLEGLGKLYRSSPAGPGQTEQVLGRVGIPFTPAIEQLFKDPNILRDMLAQAQKFTALQNTIGVDVDDLANRSRLFVRQWHEFVSVLELIQAKFEGPLITPVTNFLKTVEVGLISVSKYISDLAASKDWEELGRKLAGGLSSAQVGAAIADGISAALNELFDPKNYQWAEYGSNAADAFVRGFFEEISKAFPSHFDQFMDYIRGGLMRVPGIGSIPGVAPRESELPQPAPRPLPQDAPHFQTGGVVPIMAHAGELIFGADLTRMFMDWLRGGGGLRPLVKIDNVDELTGGAYRGGATPNLVPGGALSNALRGPGRFTPANAATFKEMGDYISTQYGLDGPHVRAMLANVWAESKGDPQAIGPGGDLGLFQDVGTRRTGLLNYLQMVGATLSSRFAQIDYAMKELRTRDPGWLLPGTAEYLTRRWEANFEGPAVRTGRVGDLATIDNMFAASPPGVSENNYHAGDRSITVNAQHNFNIQGTDPAGIGGALRSATSRTNADLVRNLTPLIQ